MIEVTDIPRLPPRDAQAHKGSFGTVLCVAGSRGMLGAAILAARGALRGGAGLVRAALPGASLDAFTVAVPAATTLDRDALGAEALLDGATAVVAGPGLGQRDAEAMLLRDVLARCAVPMVLDADALNLHAPLRGSLPTRAPTIVTPHPGEAARLLKSTVVAVQRDRAAAVRELARRSGGVAVLKGAGTLVCDGERSFRNTTGNPGLATGGSGDVLAGLLGALLAQGLAPFDAACLAVHVHGRAGDRVAARLSQPGLCAEDLPLAIAEELAAC
ncbi:MAG: NAD(P)H-hydrate dehydratase [Planctomycetes bacterium]|nr:NAD(P)H-hydrate dehydratase [Planctomycetota bacterium]